MAQEELDINYFDIEMTVIGHYTPMEEVVMYDSNGTGDPGSPSEFEVEEIIVGGFDIYDIIDDKALRAIKEECLTEIEGI